MNTFQEALANYFDAWNEAFKTKDENLIRSFMSKSFKGYWAHGDLLEPDQYDYHYDLKEVINQYNGDTIKSFEPLSLTERKNGEQILVLGTEKAIINGIAHHANCMFIWQKESKEWKLLREYIELV